MNRWTCSCATVSRRRTRRAPFSWWRPVWSSQPCWWSGGCGARTAGSWCRGEVRLWQVIRLCPRRVGSGLGTTRAVRFWFSSDCCWSGPSRCGRGSRWLPVSLLAGLVGLVLAANLTVQAWHERREMRPDLEFSLAAVPASQPVTLVLSHVPTWQAWISFSGLTGMGIGAILAWMSRSRARGTAARNGLLATSAVALGAGLLAQPLGAVFFFPWVSGGAFLGLCTPAAVRLAQSWRRRRSDSSAEGGGATTMTSALGAVVLLVAGLGHGPEVRAEKAAPPPTAATVLLGHRASALALPPPVVGHPAGTVAGRNRSDGSGWSG
jgi:hypothetical protein